MSWWHFWGKRHRVEPNAKEKATDKMLSEPEPIELMLYESSSKPTKIKKWGMAVSSRKDAEEVRAHFMEFDRSYEQLFRNVFDENLDEIDELDYGKKELGSVFAITGHGIKINAAYEFCFRDVIVFSVNDNTYEFSKPTHPIDFPEGHYNFSGNLSEKDYRELVEPNADIGKDEPSGKTEKSCYRHDNDGSSGGTIKAEVVPELMKRIISYAKP